MVERAGDDMSGQLQEIAPARDDLGKFVRGASDKWASLDAKLRELWTAGKSASQIAQALRPMIVSRSAVLGRIHRLKLPARQTPIKYGPPGGKGGWSDEQKAILRRMWAEGLPVSDIAEATGRTQRWYVTAMAKKLELGPHPNRSGGRISADAAGDDVQSVPTMGVSPVAVQKRAKQLAKKLKGPNNWGIRARGPRAAPTKLQLAPDPHCLKLLSELGNHDCRWPAGEGAEMRFCGAPADAGRSYCHHHHARAYTKRSVLLAQEVEAA